MHSVINKKFYQKMRSNFFSMKKEYKATGSALSAFLIWSLKGSAKNLISLLWYHIHSRYKRSEINVKTIEFICNGNICRSVFAEKYAAELLEKKRYSIKSTSSGLWAKEGSCSPAEAIRAASMFNVDLSDHFSKRTDVQHLLNADLIFCMHINQYRRLCKMFPACKEKTFLLKAYTKPICFDINVEDPYGKSIQQFFRCFEEISSSIKMVVRKIERGKLLAK